MQQCITCREKEEFFYKLSESQRYLFDQKNGKKYDYYFCRHNKVKFETPAPETEVERWNDKMCVVCAQQLNCCRTCAIYLKESDSD